MFKINIRALFKISSKANIFFAIFVILSFVSTLTILVYNNLSILRNNTFVGTDNNDLSSIIYEKGDIIINSVKDYNSNGNGYNDSIGCPQNITMSGTTMSGTNLSSQLVYSNGTIYCSGIYNSNEFRIYFNENYISFLQYYFKNDIVSIVKVGENYIGERNFNDDDSTLVSFTSDGVGGDNIDDNFNSDNYRIDSDYLNYYPDFYQDDDVTPRKTIFSNILAGTKLENIFWNNYQTNSIIDLNTNNLDYLNLKAGDVENAIIYLDLFNNSENDFDLIIYEFDKQKYENDNTLIPINKYIGNNLTANEGYIKNNSGNLFLGDIIESDEFVFDFKNKDYGIFISNNTTGNIVLRLSAITQDGKGIYITPVNDSNPGIIEVVVNNIFIDGENNFIGENIKIINKK